MPSSDTYFKPGNCANPTGRPKGSTGLKWFNEVVNGRQKGILEKCIQLAEDGDPEMIKYVLSRYIPIKGRIMDGVDLSGKNHTQQADEILMALDQEHITAEEACEMLTALQQRQQIFQQDEFVRRLEKIEEANKVKENK